MKDPFEHVTGPACVSFSGGRTSGYMLWRTLQAHGGTLPEDVHCIFSNTGKERLETLDFVQRCATEWSVPVTWLEFDPEAEHRTRVVNHNSAARDGEPFKAAIVDRQLLPNPVARFCTAELKVRRISKYMHKILGYDHWINHIGLRADEQRRVAKSKIDDQKQRWDTEAPLARAGVTKRDVTAFWRRQPFALELPNMNHSTPAGNCDLCFLKSRQTIQALIHEDPSAADWWIEMEALGLASKPSGATFRNDRPSYARMRDQVANQEVFEFGDESSIDCFCTD